MNAAATFRLFFVSALVSGIPLGAQPVPFDFTWPISSTIDTSGGVTSMATGDFNGDWIADAFVVIDGIAYFVPCPDVFSSLFPIDDLDAVDVATLPAAGWNGIDAVLVVGADGLHVVQRGSTTSAMSATLLASGWTTVVQLCVADVDGDANVDVLGLDGDGTTLRRLEANGSGWDSSTSSFTQLGASAVIEIDVLDWNGDADLEVAAVLNDGFAVYDLSMTRQAIYQGAAVVAGVTAQPVRHASGGKDRLAIVYWTPSDTQWLKEISSNHESAGLGLGILGVVSRGTAAADLLPSMTTPRGDDLVLSHTFSPWQPVLFNISTTTATSEPFSDSVGAAMEVQSWNSPSSANAATPGIADLDNDGDPDVLMAWADAPATMYVVRSVDTDEESRKIYVGSEESLLSAHPTIPGRNLLTITLAEPAVHHGDEHYVELVVWHRGVDLQGEPLAGVDPTPQSYYYDVSGGWEDGRLEATIDVYEDVFPTRAQYFILARHVNVDESGAYLEVGPHGMNVWVGDQAEFQGHVQTFEEDTETDSEGSPTPPFKSGGIPVGGTCPTMVPIDPFDPANGEPDPPTSGPPLGGGGSP